MTPEQDKAICKAFPILYRDRNKGMMETCMCWGFDIGPGWINLIWDLSEKLEKIAENQDPPKKHSWWKKPLWYLLFNFCNFLKSKKLTQFRPKFLYDFFWGPLYTFLAPPEDNRLVAVQVKSKYGALCFYIHGGTEEAYSLIDEAEDKSERMCEECGADAKSYDLGWVYTLCPTHLKDYEEKKRRRSAL